MALKELLVHLDQSKGADIRLQLAMGLAIRHGCHLTTLFVEEWTEVQTGSRATAEMGLAHASALDILDHAVSTQIQAIASRLRRTLDDTRALRGMEATWLQEKGFHETVMQHVMPGADLCLVGPGERYTRLLTDSEVCESLLISARTPLVFVPRAAVTGTLGSRILVAWDSSRAAARALNDSMALIERAEQTWLVNVAAGRQTPTAESLKLTTDRLRRHCGSVEALRVQMPHRTVAEVLQLKARELGADLMVCGAFGHSRMRETLFGGVTRDLLDNTELPLLLSH